MVLNLRDRQQTPAAPGLESQKVEEGGEHDFNILGNGQKVYRARGKGQNAARLQSTCWVTDSSTVCGLQR